MGSDEVKMPDLGKRVVCSVVWSLMGMAEGPVKPTAGSVAAAAAEAVQKCSIWVLLWSSCISAMPFRSTFLHQDSLPSGRGFQPHAPYRSQVSYLSSW